MQSLFAVMGGRLTVDSIGLQKMMGNCEAKREKMGASMRNVPTLTCRQRMHVGHPFL